MHKQRVPKLAVSRIILHRRNRNKAGQKSHSSGSNSNSASFSQTKTDARSSATNFSIYVIWRMLFLWDMMLHQWVIGSPHFEETMCPRNISISQNLQLCHCKNIATSSYVIPLQTFMYIQIHQTHVPLGLNGSGG